MEVAGPTPPSELLAAAGEVDWSFPARRVEADGSAADALLGRVRYGFNNAHAEFFAPLMEELPLILDSPAPDSLTVEQRRAAMREREAGDFDSEHYMAEYAEPEAIDELLGEHAPVPWWAEAYQTLREWAAAPEHAAAFADFATSFTPRLAFPVPTPGLASPVPATVIELDTDERDELMALPAKEHLVDEPTRELNGLLEILAAYAYDMRMTGGEHNVESAWTVAKLNGLTSWLTVPHSPREALLSVMRRSLVYPLYRSWKLASRIRRDALMIACTGRMGVLKALLDIHKLFKLSEDKYYFNELYIEDYCVWIQSLSDATYLAWLASSLTAPKISKADLGADLDIPFWEAAADDRLAGEL
ncbi:uncharacterized protein AMSG_03242 [Thecamonas trahens ATCC 50062]|uniref:Shq1 C-terminal domain-containing protein n=1 Tax=Thecamonas trahens ATCC 50062 TaxID=461836 RepID=A0A0L0D3Z5_THETB|nr:hypothetical protein AMSG_03242 [Thecamonas trahens ATCC 50062]KNC46811.1 hypothetical protein AMSG_03242 [Thecamonas trahens ATCC 50062]|eukprot:XP_013760086.1 hypothetical protein AMSG_03242 [Thecamonas trahens ATCC 50062]